MAPPSTTPFLHRVRLRNYKSIARCDIELGRFTVLVGRNGAGKSNFLDALRFVAESLQHSLAQAVRTRGGLDSLRYAGSGPDGVVSIELIFSLPDDRYPVPFHEAGERWVYYGFEIGAGYRSAPVVNWEQLLVSNAGATVPVTRGAQHDARGLLESLSELDQFYRVENGSLHAFSDENEPPVLTDRLYLVHVSGWRQFRTVYDALEAMGFYNLDPQAIGQLQSPDAGELLYGDGGNLASVVARLSEEAPDTRELIRQYLEAIVPGLTDFHHVQLGNRETLQFQQRIAGSDESATLLAENMSDGTLRTLAILVAIHQTAAGGHGATLVGIEEPETALHPAASGALLEALRSASRHEQIVLTSHSPDLLDGIDIDTDTLLVVENRGGRSCIATIDQASRQTMKEHLYSAGELLRMDQLEADENDLRRQDALDSEPDEGSPA